MEIDSNKLGKAGKRILKTATKPRLTPSILSKLMICPAYISRQLSVQDRFRFLGFHALAVQKVIARHLKVGYILEKIEAKSGFGRIDLIFKIENNERKRQVEVKSGKNIYLYAKYQAALYWNGTDELVVSNPISDTVLPLEFIMNTQERAEATKNLIINRPSEAAMKFMPHEEICRICANTDCTFLPNRICDAKGEA
ncbi:hypothetical protein ACFLQ6_01475 [Thermoproteota archaeon]